MGTPTTGLKLFCMFPGQGSQYVGMGRQLLAEFPYTKEIFEEAEDATRLPIRRLCLDGPEEELKLTANTQPAILTVSTAAWRVFQRECSIQGDLFAGHSLGEYSALVATGKLTLARASWLVRQRGESMQRAVPEGLGAMAAVLNFEESKLLSRCKEVAVDDMVVEIVNFNSPQQLVVAGHTIAIQKLVQTLDEKDHIRAVLLPVSAPFHSSLMAPARQAMEPLLRESELRATPQIVVPNVKGETGGPYDIEFLVAQIDSAVRWTQTMQTAAATECTAYLEVGPGRVLFGLGRRLIQKDAKILHSDDIVAAVKDLSAL